MFKNLKAEQRHGLGGGGLGRLQLLRFGHWSAYGGLGLILQSEE
jgi:hypothetical protein